VTWVELLEADGSWVPKYLVVEPLYVSISADETMEVRGLVATIILGW